MKDRYVGADDPRPDIDVPPDSHPANAPGAQPAAGIEEPAPAAETPQQPPESEIDRCVRVTREVLLGRPGPHSLEAAAVEIERRLREPAQR